MAGKEETIAYIGVGSNLGERERNLRQAIEQLAASPKIEVLRIAPVYSTKPLGVEGQPDYLNTVVELRTSLDAYELLGQLLSIEKRLGRLRGERWAARTIDLDLLLYGSLSINQPPHLVVPHPRLTERAFVIVPLAEINPELLLPGGMRAKELAAKLKKEQEVELFSETNVFT